MRGSHLHLILENSCYNNTATCPRFFHAKEHNTRLKGGEFEVKFKELNVQTKVWTKL